MESKTAMFFGNIHIFLIANSCKFTYYYLLFQIALLEKPWKYLNLYGFCGQMGIQLFPADTI